jgi:ABC-type phosphate transport system substrate-binding protein
MKNKFQNSLISLLVIASVSATSVVKSADNETIAIIVSKTSKLQKLDAGELTLIYLRKKLYSSEGKRIIPINLPPNHGVRKQFSSVILGSAPEMQAEYWNEAYYHGITPPHVVGSEDAAIMFVAITPSAIAYINACKLNDAVKAIAWLAPDGSMLQQSPNFNCP